MIRTSLLCAAIFLVSFDAYSQNRSTGLKPSDESAYAALTERELLSQKQDRFPRWVDLSFYMPPPKDQKATASCVPSTLGYSIKSYYGARDLDRKTTPDRYFSDRFVYDYFNRSESCDTAISLSDALNFLQDTGIKRDADYEPEGEPCSVLDRDDFLARHKSAAAPHAIEDWRRLRKAGDQGYLPAIKDALIKRDPVAVSLPVPPSFEKLRTTVVYTLSTKEAAAIARNKDDLKHHALVVIGYDDDRGALLAQNSWTDWGENGRGWIAYDAAARLFREAYTIQDKPTLSQSPEFSEDDLRASLTMLVDRWDKKRSVRICVRNKCDGREGDRLARCQERETKRISGRLNRYFGSRGDCKRYYPTYIYLDLPRSKLQQIESVSYRFAHWSFSEVNEAGADVHDKDEILLGYPHKSYLWGCAKNDDSEAVATTTSGKVFTAKFNMCAHWRRAREQGLPFRALSGGEECEIICKRQGKTCNPDTLLCE